MGGSLLQEEINHIKLYGIPYSEIKNFVETGTYKADSTILASQNYHKVYTIEIFQPLYEESKQRLQNLGIKNVNCLLGDSLEHLHNIMPKVSDGSIFFIDAHISGSDSGWNGKIRVPLIEELDIILSYELGPSVFIFDDLRLWKSIQAWDWNHINNDTLLSKISAKHKVFTSFEKNDRFFVFTI